MKRRTRYRSQLTPPPQLRRKPARRRIRIFRTRASVPPVSRTQPKASRLTRARRVGLLLLIVCCALGVWLFVSDTFYVNAVEVEGNHMLTREQVVAASGVNGVNIFFVRPSAVAAQVKKLQYVHDARVSSILPNRVLIRVTEREPAIALRSGDTQYVVDSEGLVIPAPPMTGTEMSPVYVSQMLHPGEKMDPGAVATAQAIRKLRPEATSLVYTAERGIGLVTSQGVTVYLGTDPALVAEQLGLLDRLTPQLEAKANRIEFLDLRFPGHPYLKEK